MGLTTENSPVTIYQIYVLTNVVNKKKYVGQTCGNVGRRWAAHKSASKKRCKLHFHYAILKYGPENFALEVVAFTFTKPHADELEEAWIKQLDTIDRSLGYNCTLGGEGARHTPDVRKKISQARMGKPGPQWNEEQRRNRSDSQKGEKGNNWGKKASEETRQKMSLAHSGENNHCFGLTGSLHPHFGHKHTEEHLLKMSVGMSGEKNHRFGKPGTMLGKIQSEEAKTIISVKAKARFAGGAVNSFSGKKHSEETKKKMRDAWARRRELIELEKIFTED